MSNGKLNLSGILCEILKTYLLHKKEGLNRNRQFHFCILYKQGLSKWLARVLNLLTVSYHSMFAIDIQAQKIIWRKTHQNASAKKVRWLSQAKRHFWSRKFICAKSNSHILGMVGCSLSSPHSSSCTTDHWSEIRSAGTCRSRFRSSATLRTDRLEHSAGLHQIFNILSQYIIFRT